MKDGVYERITDESVSETECLGIACQPAEPVNADLHRNNRLNH